MSNSEELVNLGKGPEYWPTDVSYPIESACGDNGILDNLGQLCDVMYNKYRSEGSYLQKENCRGAIQATLNEWLKSGGVLETHLPNTLSSPLMSISDKHYLDFHTAALDEIKKRVENDVRKRELDYKKGIEDFHVKCISNCNGDGPKIVAVKDAFNNSGEAIQYHGIAALDENNQNPGQSMHRTFRNLQD